MINDVVDGEASYSLTSLMFDRITMHEQQVYKYSILFYVRNSYFDIILLSHFPNFKR